jgi:predicted nucleotidyltransferase component of viral defense system
MSPKPAKKKAKPQSGNPKALTLEGVKRAAVIAMFSDNELFDSLVLKGGNALDLIHKLSERASVDLDFSMEHDIQESTEDFCKRVESALNKTFQGYGYSVFDVKMEERPEVISAEVADFWGGYAVEFKLVSSELYKGNEGSLDELRKYALTLGRGKKFLIDVSRFEYTTGKQEAELDGYRIYVYSPEMIVCEKLRAICQQMPEYGPIVKRGRQGSARARDFWDIYVLVNSLRLDFADMKNVDILREMFRAKRVPMELLNNIGNYRDFHRADFPSVAATVKAGVKLEEFDFYFNFVLDIVKKLKSLGHI